MTRFILQQHHGLFKRVISRGLVYRRGDGEVRVVPGEAAVLEGLQERRRRDGDRSILRDAVQRSVDDELLQRQVERIPRFPSRHPSGPHLQTYQTLSRSSGESARAIDFRVANFVESSFESSFELLQFLLDEFFVTKFTG